MKISWRVRTAITTSSSAGIARPLAQAVDGAFHLARAVQHRGQGVGHGQTEIVVAMHRENRLVGIGNALAQGGESGCRTDAAGCSPRCREYSACVAPASITASSTRHRKSGSERPASSGENSTLSVHLRAHFTAFTACSTTWSGLMRSFFSMWIGRGGDEGVDTAGFGALHRLAGALDVALQGARQTAHRAVLDARRPP